MTEEGLVEPWDRVMAARVLSTGQARPLLEARILLTFCSEQAYQDALERKDPLTWIAFWSKFFERLKQETGFDEDWELQAARTSYDRVQLDAQSGVAGTEEFLTMYHAAF